MATAIYNYNPIIQGFHRLTLYNADNHIGSQIVFRRKDGTWNTTTVTGIAPYGIRVDCPELKNTLELRKRQHVYIMPKTPTKSITYHNDIKIVIEKYDDLEYPEDNYYIEEHYNKDNFRFYFKMTRPDCKEFWFKSPYWTKTIDNDPNNEIRLINIEDSYHGVFVRDKCQFKTNKGSYDVNMGCMIESIE